jgi:hypothetical protein
MEGIRSRKRHENYLEIIIRLNFVVYGLTNK